MLRKKISLYYLVLATVLGSAVSVFALKILNKESEVISEEASARLLEPAQGELTIARLNGHKYTHPLYLAEPKYESNGFIGLKSGITDYIESMKTSGELDYASVYLKSLNTNDWMSVNPDNVYHPGSLFKVVTMIAFLRSAESDPSILEKEVTYHKEGVNPPTQTFNSKQIEDGHTYKVKELIYYMVAFSDNHATKLLHNYLDNDLFLSIFADFGMKKPDIYNNTYTLTVKDYSKFLSVLYDCGYLSIPSSEFATSMLIDCDFRNGITKELPQGVKVAHKFGEAGKPGNRELHESAIVYLDNKPYLLVIMTKGRESTKLAEMISHISKQIYDNMASASM